MLLLDSSGPWGALGGLDAAVEDLAIGGQVPSLSLDEGEFDAAQGDRVRAIRARLWRLGYLVDPDGGEAVDAPLRKAVHRFQVEARLTIDGWVGPQSWQWLQDLVSFDAPLNPADWVDADGADLPAFVRAVRLRLNMLGLYDLPIDADPGHTDEAWRALDAFRTLAVGFGWLAPDAKLDAVKALLFDHRRLVEGLRRPGVVALLPLEVPTRHRDLPAPARLIVRIVQWEVWLSGQPIEAEGNALDFHLGRAIDNFWDGWEGPIHEPHGPARRKVTAALIDALLLDDAEPSDVDRLDEAQIEAAVTARAHEVVKAVDKDREHGFFLWGAPGRAIRWLARRVRDAGATLADVLKGGIRWAGTAIRNLGRWLFAKAQTLVANVRRAVRVVVDALDALGGNVQAAGGLAHVALDFDTVAVLDTGAGLAEALRKRTDTLVAACGIVGAIVGVFVTIAAASTPAGWLLVVARVVRLVREVMGWRAWTDALPT